MTVEELIAALQDMDPQKTVVFGDDLLEISSADYATKYSPFDQHFDETCVQLT